MSQLPLHPMIVHFPIVLACLMPLVAGFIAWGLMRRNLPKRVWWIPLILQAVIFISAWTAVQYGEQDEERVETVVSEQVLETHEEAGNVFMITSGILLVLMCFPLLIGTRFLPPLIAVLSLVSVVLVYKAGHTGAQLVYAHNAASALQTNSRSAETGETAKPTGYKGSAKHDEDEDDD